MPSCCSAATEHPLAAFLPHRPPMILVDRLIQAEIDHIITEVDIHPEAPFADVTGVGAWVGIEYMAQSVAALVGWEGAQQQRPVQVGFLLGTRKYQCNTARFACGQVLEVEAQRSFSAENGLGAFECTIKAHGATLASATITAFQPPNLAEYLKESA